MTPTRLPAGRALRLLLATALVTTLSVVVPLTIPRLLDHANAEPVSGAFALGGGLGGSIDPRTGQFSVSMPLVNVASRGGSGVSMSLSWDQARASAGVDRYGWGAGWGLGTTFVDPTDGTTVYPANGGSYAFDGSFDSRLRNYVLRDLTYQAVAGTLAAQPGVHPALDYASRLLYDDGRIDHFDADGNLVSRVDRFGNRTDLTYDSAGVQQWQPTSIVDAYGLATTFSYGTDDDGNATVTVAAPKRSDGITSTTVVTFDSFDRLQRVTDPTGGVARFSYTSASGAGTQFLATVTGPAGAQTAVAYKTIAYPNADPLNVVDTLDVTDADGNKLSPTRRFDMDPAENDQQHNYAGNPDYLSTTEDELFASADDQYQYSTEISNGQTSTLSTYDSAHRMIARTITAGTDSGDVAVQRHSLTYPGFFPPSALPGNYARPLTAAVTSRSTSGPNGLQAGSGAGRTVATSTGYDDHGRVVEATDESGTTTVTTYDSAFGLVTSSVATGSDGTKRSVTNGLSPDGKTIASKSEAEAKAGAALSARTVVNYAYDDFGVVTARTVAWADGAAPPDNGGGPASSTTRFASTVDAAARTRTTALIIAADTPAAQTVTTVLDLVSGQATRITDALNRVTTRTYDAGGRILRDTQPTGLVTTTAYQAADGDEPATRTVTEADGHQTQTSFDPLGRVTTVTDNVRNGVFAGDPTVRTVGSVDYSVDGTTRTSTDRAGRTTTTTNDPLARPIQEVGPTGITKQVTYNDVANTASTALIGDGAAEPSQVTGKSYDALNREVSSRTTYPLPGRGRPLFLTDPVSQTSFDGIGRKTSLTAGDLTAVPDYAGPGGTPVSTVVSRAKTARAPGDPITAGDTSMITGDPTLRTLQQPGQPTRAGSQVAYDAAGNVTSITDPLGGTTSYTYTADGRPKTRTSPSGTETTNTYDPGTGQLTAVTARNSESVTTTTTYTYIPAGQPGAGLVKTLTNESGTLTYSYDADRNRVGVAYPDGTTVTSDYADNGELLTSTDATGAVTTYVYNDDSSLRSATQVRSGATLASVGHTYDGLGRIKTTTRGNGLTTTNTYTADNLLDTQTTTDRASNRVESHIYDYDNHHNLVRKTDITAPLGQCRVNCGTSPTSSGTWTTTYRYDAYDRLIGSQTYTGTTVTGTPVMAIGYALDASGNVFSTTRTTAVANQPSVTSVTSDQVDAAGQLTRRTVGPPPTNQTTNQTFDADGRVLTSLTGTTTSYRPDGLPATVSKGGATTTYRYWADGSRRSASTAAAGGATSTVTLYYRADGTLVNDTTNQGTASATASYLLTAGREARTLRTGSSAVTTGTGVGYYLRDRHNSVTALVDSAGAVTNTYAYADYGAPALYDGRPGTVTGAAAGTGVGRANAFGYAGATVRGMYTDSSLGTLMTPARFYDPAQGRFTSRDTANVHNRYMGFDSNPIMKVDPSGQSPFVDFLVDALFALVFIVSAVETGGATLAAGAEIYTAVEAGEVVAAGVSAAQAAEAVATAANVVGAVSYGTRLADDVDNTVSGKHFLSDDQRSDLANVGTLAGGIAGAAGLVGAGAKAAAAAAEAASEADAGAAGTASTLADADVRPDAGAIDSDDDYTIGLGRDDSDSSTSWERVGNPKYDADDDSVFDDLSNAASDSEDAGDLFFPDREPLNVSPTRKDSWDFTVSEPRPAKQVEGTGDLFIKPLFPDNDTVLSGDREASSVLTSVQKIEVPEPNIDGSTSLITNDAASAVESAEKPTRPRDIITSDLSKSLQSDE